MKKSRKCSINSPVFLIGKRGRKSLNFFFFFKYESLTEVKENRWTYFFHKLKKLEMCGSLNPDCLLIRFGEKANLAFSDSWGCFYTSRSVQRTLPVRQGGTLAGSLHLVTFQLIFTRRSFCSVQPCWSRLRLLWANFDQSY